MQLVRDPRSLRQAAAVGQQGLGGSKLGIGSSQLVAGTYLPRGKVGDEESEKRVRQGEGDRQSNGHVGRPVMDREPRLEARLRQHPDDPHGQWEEEPELRRHENQLSALEAGADQIEHRQGRRGLEGHQPARLSEATLVADRASGPPEGAGVDQRRYGPEGEALRRKTQRGAHQLQVHGKKEHRRGSDDQESHDSGRSQESAPHVPFLGHLRVHYREHRVRVSVPKVMFGRGDFQHWRHFAFDSNMGLEDEKSRDPGTVAGIEADDPVSKGPRQAVERR